MRYRLSITAEDTGIVTMYNVILIDGNANLVWNQNEDYLYYKKSINGTFILNCHDNSSCYGAILLLSICNKIEMDIWEDGGTDPIYQGYFYKRDCTIDEDRGSISFTPKEINPYDCLEKRFDVELNILAPPTTQTILDNSVTAVDSKNYEIHKVVQTDIYLTNVIFYDIATKQYIVDKNFITTLVGGDDLVNKSKSNIENSYYQYSSAIIECVKQGTGANNFGAKFNVTTNWVRKSILSERLNNGANTCPDGGNDNGTIILNGTEYNVCIDIPNYTYINDYLSSEVLVTPYDTFTIVFHQPSADDTRVFTRAKKLDHIIKALIEPCGFATYTSSFLTSAINPISGYDLRYLYISQMSDCIWTDIVDPPNFDEPGDPATKGMITLRQLLNWLKYAFQVYPYIHTDGTLYLEHIRWFKNGHTYAYQALDGYRNSFTNIGALTPLDIEVMYFNFAKGMNKYTYEGDIPLKEKLSYAQAFNEPFKGTPISYEDCVDNNTINEFALQGLCADIDMSKLISTNSDVSNEGFMIFHCDSDLNVVIDMDEFTHRFNLNGHLAIGSLQHYYWMDDRWIENVLMNDEETVTYNPKKLRKQVDIKVPSCLSTLLASPYYFPYCFVKTELGSDEIPPLYGEVETAEWSFKTKMLTLKLRYEC